NGDRLLGTENTDPIFHKAMLDPALGSGAIQLREVLQATPAFLAARQIIVAAIRTNHGCLQIRNPKFEIQNKFEIRNLKQDFAFPISDFEFVSDFALWISDLLHYPGIVAGEKFFELAAAFLGHHILELFVEKIVVGGMLHAAIDSDAFRKARIDHSAQEISQA